MKKIYVIALFILISAGLSYSQILTSSHTITYYSGPDSVKLTAHADITNNSNQTLNILCESVSKHLSANHYSYFCWVVCYDTSVSLSPNPISIAPGGVASNFEGWVGSGNTSGHDDVTYRFYDMNGNSDTLYLTFNYDFFGTTGIAEITSSKYFLSIDGSNPAGNSTTINYAIPPQKNARLVISNLLGSIVKEVPLNINANSLTISLADLRSGVYIYSLDIDGILRSSKKLIISH